MIDIYLVIKKWWSVLYSANICNIIQRKDGYSTLLIFVVKSFYKLKGSGIRLKGNTRTQLPICICNY